MSSLCRCRPLENDTSMVHVEEQKINLMVHHLLQAT